MCPQYMDAPAPTLTLLRGMTLGQPYHTLKGLDVGVIQSFNFLAQMV